MPIPAAGTAPPAPSWLDELQGLARTLPGLVSDRVELFVLELQRAGLVLAQIALLIVAVAILGVTAWLALWACVVGLLMLAGLHWSGALLGVLLVNLLCCWLAIGHIRRLAPALHLPATRRHLTLHRSAEPVAPVASPVASAVASPVASPLARPLASATATAPAP